MKTYTFKTKLYILNGVNGNMRKETPFQTMNAHIKAAEKEFQQNDQYQLNKVELIKTRNERNGKRIKHLSVYDIEGIITAETKRMAKFKIFHNFRRDYFNAFPIKSTRSIKL